MGQAGDQERPASVSASVPAPALAPVPDGEADLALYLRPGFYIDSDEPSVAAFARERAGDAATPAARAVRLYYAVRDELPYDPYDIDLTPQGFRASRCLAAGRGFCITKAGLLAAAARSLGVPARVGFADVRNHLATARLRQMMGTDVFYYHGYAELYLDGRWVKATPAFNIELCRKFRVRPLEFDGRHDSIFHPFDADNRRHMEYVAERGFYADIPFAEIEHIFRTYYPGLVKAGPSGDFAAEAAAERGA